MSKQFLFAVALSLGACGDNTEVVTPDSPEPPTDTGPQAIDIDFAARIGDVPFACNQTYTGVGSAASAYKGTDFRLYLHDVRLISGTDEVAIDLEESDFQHDGVVLLDFEDASAGCDMGTTGTNLKVRGTVPPGTYTKLAFRVGVPFAKNHLDATTAAAPLNVPAMYWAWSSGYKFMKVDGTVNNAGFNLHLGSTGCGVTGPTPPTAPCTSPNTLDVTLDNFLVGTSQVVIDHAPVLADVDVSVNTAQTAPGCMSFPGDPECNTIFPKLGLEYGANAAATQQLFRIENPR
jgi:uncharacterized repeat protein (TIGR04052 family)